MKIIPLPNRGNFANLRIGIHGGNDRQKKKVKEVSEILAGAEIDHKTAEDIQTEIWRKYILNCAYNAETAYYDNTIGQLRQDPAKAAEYEALVREAYQVALAKGVAVKQEHIDAIIHRFYHELAEDATSSLQRDIQQGKRAEVDTFSGYILREAKQRNITVPVTEKMYYGLKKAENTQQKTYILERNSPMFS
jgi:2-dehydropantoate 2-reductase